MRWGPTVYHWIIRSLFIVSVTAFLAGCATNRGGLTDKVMDATIFSADTKEHRTLRGYLLLASLTRLAGRSNLNLNEKAGLASDIGRAVDVSATAFQCAYTNGHLQRPTWAHSRNPIDVMASGSASSLFQASHIASMMAS